MNALFRRLAPRPKSSLPPAFFRSPYPGAPPMTRAIIQRLTTPRRSFTASPYNSAREAQCSRFIIGFIGLNAAVWAAWQYAKTRDSDGKPRRGLLNFMGANFLLSWPAVFHGNIWVMLTSAVSHYDAMHFLANMLAFFTLTSGLASHPLFTVTRLVQLTIGAAVSGSTAFLLNHSTGPSRNRRGLGASAIVSGITTTLAFVAPRATVNLFGIIPMPMWFFGLATILYDTYFMGSTSSMIGHDAHLGGAAFGYLFYVLKLRRGRF
ncbi:hypothetical protein EJ06DRAFT_41178 [Trichodelitschia bisporula]|uniref:Peptidase S54 rhomboid domain-containing protein n=1 Tax=Trichodelitschia bisporula TaxID=703511 RepID=A0A6G1HV73_9PEZI|nr:hypothetical protein EJ06DRAFT_41178 [Trichodelitschia bisporula]